MALTVQQLRTTTATALPAKLEPGQIALNLANGWFMCGDGSNGVSAAGAPLTPGATTIFGVNGVVVPATPPAGKGYEIYELKNPRLLSVSSVLLALSLTLLVVVQAQ